MRGTSLRPDTSKCSARAWFQKGNWLAKHPWPLIVSATKCLEPHSSADEKERNRDGDSCDGQTARFSRRRSAAHRDLLARRRPARPRRPPARYQGGRFLRWKLFARNRLVQKLLQGLRSQ